MRSIRNGALLAVAATTALTLAACGSSSSGGAGSGSAANSGSGAVTLTWWNNATANPLATCPTATDAQGAGKLRLTQNIANQEGGVFASTSVPTSQGLDVTFDSYPYLRGSTILGMLALPGDVQAGGPDASLEPEELFFRLQSDVQGMTAEADLEVLTPELRLAPGERGELTVRVASHLASGLRGELQLISPIGTWRATAPWTQAVTVPPGGEASASFAVTVPATAEPGWQSWLLVKLMYFGRVRYSQAVPLTVT